MMKRSMKLSKFIHLSPQRKPASKNFLKIRIAHPGFLAAIKNINMVHSTTGFKPRGMMLVGETGAGKTTILEYYREQYCALLNLEIQPPKGKYPVLLTRLQADSGKKSFLRSLCIELGVDPKPRETVNDLEHRVITLIKNREVEIVLIDEFHHLAGKAGKQHLDTIGDLIKNLMDITKVPFVLVGTLKALSVLVNHPELQRRFAASTKLTNLNLNSAEEEEQFKKFMSACHKNCGIPSVAIDTTPMLERFCLASKGRIGIITAIVETAINMADDEVGITMPDLADAFDFCRADPFTPKCNPFSASLQTVKKELGRAK